MAAKGRHNDPEILRTFGIIPASNRPPPTAGTPLAESPMVTRANRPDGRSLADLGVRSLAEILRDPHALEPPSPTVPRLAWKGRVTLLAAREKCGKSTLASAGAAAVTRGGSFLGESCTEGSVLWCNLDREHVADLTFRLQSFRAEPEGLFTVEHFEEPKEDLATITEELRPRLIVVDTLSKLGELMGIHKPSSSAAWSPVMSCLTGLARDFDAAVLVLHHSRKSDGQYRDSSAIGAGVDVILEMSDDGQDETARHLRGRGRFSIRETSIRLAGTAYEVVGAPVTLKERILAHVELHPGTIQRDLRDALGGKSETLTEAVQGLIAGGRLENRGTGNSFRLCVPESTARDTASKAREPLREPRNPPENGVFADSGSHSQPPGVPSGNRSGSDAETEPLAGNSSPSGEIEVEL